MVEKISGEALVIELAKRLEDIFTKLKARGAYFDVRTIWNRGSVHPSQYALVRCKFAEKILVLHKVGEPLDAWTIDNADWYHIAERVISYIETLEKAHILEIGIGWWS
jgi:hypothetical protein